MANTPDWKKIKHARGLAKSVPSMVKKFIGRDPDVAESVFGSLYDSLVRRGQWFEASAPTVELLLEVLPKALQKDMVLVLLAEIVGADHVRAWLAPLDDGVPADVLDAVITRKRTIFDALASKDADVRAAAFVLLATLPPLAGEVLPAAKATAVSDEDDVVRASALLALGRLGAGDPDVEMLVARARDPGAPPVVRGAAALAWLRLDARRAVEDVAPEIEAWLGWPVPETSPGPTQLPWFGGLCVGWYAMMQPFSATSRGLAELCRHRGSTAALIDFALGLGRRTTSDTAARCLGELLLDLGGFWEQYPDKNNIPYVAPPEALSSEQRSIAARLADTPLLPAAGHGLAASGDGRRRWIGLLPPGPLERNVRITLDGQEVELPFWRARSELEARRVYGSPFPPPLDRLLSGRDRWQAIVELCARSYGGIEIRVMAHDVLERELGALVLDNDFFSYAMLDLAPSRRIGENVLRRLAHADVRRVLREQADAYLARVRELAQREPGLHEALESTR